MKKFISFGEYNILYKHILFYVFTKYIYDYALSDFLEAKANDLIHFPKDILIQQAFNYFISLIGSIFLFFYEKKQENQTHNNKYPSPKKKCSNNVIELIQNDLLEDKNLSISDYFIILLLFLSMQINKAFFVFGLKGLDYWMHEIFFMSLINSKIFDIPIYKHKKIGIFIIIFFCTLFKILSTINRIIDKENQKLYTFYPGIVSIGIIFYLIIIILRAYSFCKIKWICDAKFILPSKILLLYNCLGTFLCFIASIIPHFYPCTESYNNNIKANFKDVICKVKDENDSKKLYYDNYSIYFKIFCKDILVSIIIFVVKTTFCFFNKIFTIYIVKNLSPEYIICSNSIFYFIAILTDICHFLLLKNLAQSQDNKIEGFNLYKYYEMIAEIFCFLGSLIYLELIELHFCQSDYNLKKNIKNRADKDIYGGGLFDDESSAVEKNENDIYESTTQELIKTMN